MAHRIETKIGQAVSYQLQVTGTPPITCQVLSGPPGIAIDPTTRTMTIPGSAFTETKVYSAAIMCANCNGSQAVLTFQINVGEDINCAPITPPTVVQQQFVYNTAPVRVPNTLVGIHGATHDSGGVEYPNPPFVYDFVRSHGASTQPLSGEQDQAFTTMWRGMEKSPGVYDFAMARRWAQKFDKPIMWTFFGTPEFYAKYNDGSADAYRGVGINDKFLYPGAGNFNSPPADPQRLVDYARALLADPVLGPRIISFELWNEALFPTDGADRWSVQWGAAHYADFGAVQPWFSGTRGDMAGMAKALKDANLGRPLYACGFVDAHSGVAGQHTFDAVLNATSGGVALKDMLGGVSVHWYDYSGENLNAFVRDMTNYRSRLDNLGKPNLPLLNTETGDFNGTMSSTQVQRLILVAAATKLQTLALYRYSNDDAGHHMGDPVTNAATQAGITAARNAVSGKNICEAAILSDGRVWVHTSDGQQFVV